MVSGLDFDLEVDIDIDVDADVDMDTGIEGGNLDFSDVANAEVDRDHVVDKRTRKLKWWQIILIYFNFVGLPFMFTFTFWIFIWWMTSVLATALTNTYENSFGFVLVLAALVPSLFLNKIVTSPFKAFFKNLNKDGDSAVDFLGRPATLLSNISGDKIGNAEVNVDGNVMNIYVKSLDGSTLNFRDSVLIIKPSEDRSFYFVSKS